jgi:hypothetical protein
MALPHVAHPRKYCANPSGAAVRLWIKLPHDQRIASARAALGNAAFTSAWGEGRAMTLEQAIEYTLATGTS